jgi:acetoin utilization deacetylase AcuC-like enzyme
MQMPTNEGENKTVAERPAATGTGYVFEPDFVRHVLEPGHPESPERLKAIERMMRESGLGREVRPIPASGDPDAFMRLVHPGSHIDLAGRQAFDDSICRLAVAGGLRAVDAVCSGEVRNAFCAVRPPGHHAVDFGEFGFCFYNNIAIAAHYARRQHAVERVLIVDWDYHHGNGTEWAFYDDPSVMYFSTHRLEAFPGTGFAERTGEGKGQGFNINVPLPGGADDAMILDAFEKRLVPVVERFKPGLILISAGFDARREDLLGDMAITDDGFRRLTRLVMALADAYADGRVVGFLEGGYNIQGLASAVEAHIGALLEG